MATPVSSAYLNRTTPGVYVTEIPAFGSSIVGVATAVPVFVGYTQYAGDPVTGAPLYMKPVEISSMSDFITHFGGAMVQGFSIGKTPPAPTPLVSGATAAPPVPSFMAGFSAAPPGSTPPASGAGITSAVASTGFDLKPGTLPTGPHQFNLYWQMRMFFANGGGNCFIVSVGSYWSGKFPISIDPDSSNWSEGEIELGTPDIPLRGLLGGLTAASYAIGPTMIVIPEACQLDMSNGYDQVVQGMLQQASSLQDRVAIIDLPGCMTAKVLEDLDTCQSTLAEAIAPAIASASYGAAYAPALNASIVTINDILYTNIADPDGANETVNNILTTQAYQLYGPAQGKPASPHLNALQAAIAAAFPVAGTTSANTSQYSGDASNYPLKLKPGDKAIAVPSDAAGLRQYQSTLDDLLLVSLPIFAQIEKQIAKTMNIMPPSGAMAGVWTKSDALNGVWNAPANIALSGVVSPLYIMSDGEQGAFNVPTSGQAIDIIRAQPGRGNVVWGARTLDGNSRDYRYIQIRRTLIYVEQSIKLALQSYVFAANDAMTWSTVISSVSSFLTDLWQRGGLMGDKASEAFTVSCGLGSTMTAQNVLDGYMVVAISMQMVHPAEFIELTFTQTMGS